MKFLHKLASNLIAGLLSIATALGTGLVAGRALGLFAVPRRLTQGPKDRNSSASTSLTKGRLLSSCLSLQQLGQPRLQQRMPLWAVRHCSDYVPGFLWR